MFQKSSWLFFWIPLGITVGAMITCLLVTGVSMTAANALSIPMLAGLAYFFIAMIVWFAKKRVAAGLGALACPLISGGTLAVSIVVMIVYGFAKGDTFADSLTLPTGVTLEEPRDQPAVPSKVEDTFQDALRASLSGTGGTDPHTTPSVPSLGVLQTKHPDLLQQYLTAHPGWRVYKDGRRRLATRRWANDGRWQMSLHGYYSEFHGPRGPRFQSRTTLGFSGKPWAHRAQKLPSGTAIAPKLSPENSMQESHVVFDEGDWGQYYGARFEVWFDPASGGSERKLLESNWKIEGWMH